MKGIVYTEVGSPDVLKIMELEKPVPKDNQVLIKVKTSSLNNADYMRFINQAESGKIPFSTRLMDTVMLKAVGKVLGTEVSGIVDEVGKNVKNFKKGDEVFAITVGFLGGWAEYALANEIEVSAKPANLSLEEASAVPIGGVVAMAAVRAANIKKGQEVLVYGASGTVGQFVVQFSKYFGAIVTGVCSTRNIEMLNRIGADYVIDYKKDSVFENGKTYDIIIAVNGYNYISKYKKTLKSGGIYIAIGGAKQGIEGMLFGPFVSLGSGKKFTFVTYFNAIKQNILPYIKETIENGKIKPFIEKMVFPEEITEILKNIAKNHAQGKIIIDMKF